jgi:monothiol glutaredoxin
MADDILQTIKEQVTKDRVVLYMKGDPNMPQCGFSSAVCQALRETSRPFVSYDVLEDDRLREGIKTFSKWPTIPQLYVDGEFVGGCDIVVGLFESGRLQSVLDGKQA